jgi:hypothetical protein
MLYNFPARRLLVPSKPPKTDGGSDGGSAGGGATLTDVGVLGSRQASVGSLGAPQAELQELDLVLARGNAKAGRVRGHEAGKSRRR